MPVSCNHNDLFAFTEKPLSAAPFQKGRRSFALLTTMPHAKDDDFIGFGEESAYIVRYGANWALRPRSGYMLSERIPLVMAAAAR